jgi:hypothetical protein
LVDSPWYTTHFTGFMLQEEIGASINWNVFFCAVYLNVVQKEILSNILLGWKSLN